MGEDLNLSEYISRGIENIIKDILKSSIKNPKETAFITKYMLTAKAAEQKRASLESNGEHIPPFLMASISTSCNLYCKGCYARSNMSCGDNLKGSELSENRWEQIFTEAADLGISFILLLGGEPLLRREIIKKAASVKKIIFPVFTNGTMFDDEYINLFNKNRNLVPMISIEGDKVLTDSRRGTGTYELIASAMDKLNKKGIILGNSITVTTENLETVTNKEFVQKLYDKGSRAILYAEYVPVTKSTKNLAPTDKERIILEEEIGKLRNFFPSMVFLSFPGDEKYSGGCLAAGRGFFHINANGGAEPCPFSPYSDTSLKECSLREALNSPLFNKLNNNKMLLGEHDGGCLLFEKEEHVKKLLEL